MVSDAVAVSSADPEGVYLAVTVTVPALRPVTWPAELTVAREVLLTLQLKAVFWRTESE